MPYIYIYIKEDIFQIRQDNSYFEEKKKKYKRTGFGNERDLAKSRMYWDKNLYFKIITQVSHRKNDHKVALNLEVKSKVLKPEPFNEP